MSELAEPIKTLPENDKAVRAWLEGQMSDSRPYLLAFADDGLIWGRLNKKGLVTYHDLEVKQYPNEKSKWVSPELRGKTLQQALLFGGDDEIRLFRDEMRVWQARVVTDGPKEHLIRESQILWGDKTEGQPQDGFWRVSEYRSGIPDQYIPINAPFGEGQCIRLDIHHTVDFDLETGEAYVAISRLAGLRIGRRNEEV